MIGTKARGAAARLPAWTAAALLLVVLRLLAPGGYLGGGGDDYYYLDAARCVARAGWCLPTTHWASRWPLVAPMGGVLGIAGEHPWSVAVVPLLYTLAGLVLFAANVDRRFGRGAAALATVVLVATPAFSQPALQPSIDAPEFAWLMAALLAMQAALERRSARAAALAGACIAMAVMARMSALAVLPLIALALIALPLAVPPLVAPPLIALAWPALPASARRLALPFCAALAAPLAIEALGYAIATGDAGYGWALSLNHARIPSSELPAGVDLSRGALFNLDLVRHWRRSMGIEVHWAIDPLLNLVADPRSGLTLVGAAVLALVYRRGCLTRADRRAIGAIALAAVAHAMILVFVLAIDPKPRMFLLELAAAAATIGVIGAHAWRHGHRLLPGALVALLLLRAVVTSLDMVEPSPVGPIAAGWIAASPVPVGTGEWTRRSLALTPSVAALPPPRPAYAWLDLSTDACTGRDSGGRDLLRARRIAGTDPAPVAWLRRRGILFGRREAPVLCLFAPSRAVPRPAAPTAGLRQDADSTGR